MRLGYGLVGIVTEKQRPAARRSANAQTVPTEQTITNRNMFFRIIIIGY